jgi:hypothetical protein
LKTGECYCPLPADTFLGFSHDSFEEWQAAICRFPKEFCENRGNVQPIGRKGLKFIRDSACTPCLQKSFVNSKAFGV